ncbi:unnamed protein product [Lathyrus oleraceus]
MKWAFETLERYKKRFCMFNDDIQGTAGVALAGLLGTVRSQGRPLSDFVNQKIVVVGAGSAGLGVLKMAIEAVARTYWYIGIFNPVKFNEYKKLSSNKLPLSNPHADHIADQRWENLDHRGEV